MLMQVIAGGLGYVCGGGGLEMSNARGLSEYFFPSGILSTSVLASLYRTRQEAVAKLHLICGACKIQETRIDRNVQFYLRTTWKLHSSGPLHPRRPLPRGLGEDQEAVGAPRPPWLLGWESVSCCLFLAVRGAAHRVTGEASCPVQIRGTCWVICFYLWLKISMTYKLKKTKVGRMKYYLTEFGGLCGSSSLEIHYFESHRNTLFWISQVLKLVVNLKKLQEITKTNILWEKIHANDMSRG